ncbi:MAG: amidohydrolase family protein [Pseudomonadota bacterium]|nr:amidohydrolase family protein [Pseudomonadota bacterium]
MHTSSSNSPRVDTHFHVFRAGDGVPGARYVPAYASSFESWSDAAQGQGITHGVLVQTSFLGTDNRLLADCLRAHPDRLRGIAVIAPDTPRTALEALHQAGVRGMRLNLPGTPHDMSAWTTHHHLWDTLHALGWHVELHTDMGALPPVLAALPEGVPVVVDHMGKPDHVSGGDVTVRALAARARQGQVHVKLSGSYRLAGQPPAALARLWLAELGPDHLLWGSDWPCTNHETHAQYDRLLAQLHEWISDEAVANAVLSTNPARLYWEDR